MKKVLYFFIIVILLQPGCKKSDNPVDPGDTNANLIYGELVNLTTETISTGGGEIKIVKPGDPLDGLQLTIPPNSFPQNSTFSISYAEIKSHQLGQYFKPVSPLIRIKYNGGFSERPLRLKIPIELPEGHFAMGFFYDRSTGKLEGLPVLDLDAKSVTIAARHFQSSPGGSQIQKTGQGNDSEIIGDLVISSVDERKLSQQTKISSGFLPGYDDWEFINFGSYIAAGGHCAGQALTAMWYYLEKNKKGAPQLYHAYDNIYDINKPIKMWQDNPQGYRFASTVQQDMNFDQWANDMDIQFTDPDLTFKAFALAILQSGEPQLVCIRKSTPAHEGHAMIIYAVDYPNGILYVADPNFPGNRSIDENGTYSERKIEFTANSFRPYRSSLNAGTGVLEFDQIGYFGKTAFVKWNYISARWYEFENKIVGQDRFPEYKLYLFSTSGEELRDNYTCSLNQLDILCKSQCSQMIPNTDWLQYIQVYDTKGVLITQTDGAGLTRINLKPGNNKFGIFLQGADAGGKWRYLDFKWITVKNLTLAIEPNPFVGEPNVEYKFTARSNGTAPVNARYVWNFGDGTADVIVYNDSTAKHTFTQLRDYYVTVALYDNAGQLISTASADVKITTGNYGLIKMAAKADINFLGEITFSLSVNQPSFSIGLFLDLNAANSNMTWNNDQFIFSFNRTKESYIFSDAVISGYIQGEISPDGNMIEWLKAEELVTTAEKKDSVIRRIECRNLPFKQVLFGNVNFRQTGSSLASIITKFELKRKWMNTDGTWSETYATGIDYNKGYNMLEVDFVP